MSVQFEEFEAQLLATQYTINFVSWLVCSQYLDEVHCECKIHCNNCYRNLVALNPPSVLLKLDSFTTSWFAYIEDKLLQYSTDT